MTHSIKNTDIEIPNMHFLNFNLVYILNIFPLDLAILAVSLENCYILLSNILLCLLNLQNYRILYYNKTFLDLFYGFFLLFHYVLVCMVLLIYALFLIPLISFQTLFFFLLYSF